MKTTTTISSSFPQPFNIKLTNSSSRNHDFLAQPFVKLFEGKVEGKGKQKEAHTINTTITILIHLLNHTIKLILS
jgi:hypothetical protein